MATLKMTFESYNDPDPEFKGHRVTVDVYACDEGGHIRMLLLSVKVQMPDYKHKVSDRQNEKGFKAREEVNE